MIKTTFGITKIPFFQADNILLPFQKEIYDTLKIHSQQGGLCVITGEPGVGKTVLKEHLEALNKEGTTTVISFSRTLHTYNKILKQMSDAMKIETSDKKVEKEMIHAAFKEVQARKSLITIIDEAHLLDMNSLRKLRLLFDQFPKKHNLILMGQPELMHTLSLKVNQDIKSRITYSKNMIPLNDEQLSQFILSELERARLGANTFDEAAVELILRSIQGNLRLCCNLCYGALLEACQQSNKIVNTSHVNNVLIQPHWRSHDDLIKKQARK